MIRKYVRPRQPDFVMPPHPTHHAAQASTRTARTQALADAFQLQTSYGSGSTGRKNSYKINSPQLRKVCQCRYKTIHPFSALLRMALPYALNSTKFVTLVLLSNSRHPEPALRMCQLRRRYDHATNATLLRYKSLFPRYEKCSMPLSERRAHPSNILTPSHDDIRQPRPIPEVPGSGTVWSNTSQLRQWNEWNAFQIQTMCSQIRTEFHALSGMVPSPHPDSRPIRPNQHDETRTLPKRFSSCSTPGPFSRVSRRTVGDDVYCEEPHL